MTNSVRTALIVIGVLVFGAVMLATGFFINQRWNQGIAYNFYANRQDRISGFYSNNLDEDYPFAPGTGFRPFGGGMRGRFFNYSDTDNYGSGRGFGMMDGYYNFQTPCFELYNTAE